MRLFLDANVLFTAAHNPQGLSRLLFDLARHRVVSLLSSELAVTEARANLRLKTPDRAASLEPLLPLLQIVTAPVISPPIPALPADDQLILRAAIAGRATHLLTGDKRHFGPYFDKPEQTGGVIVQTVRQFLAARFGLKGEPL